MSKLVVLCLVLISCNATKQKGSNRIASSENHFPLNLKNVIANEISIGSKDISYDYIVGIDTSLYPNKPRFKLTKVKRFLRASPDKIMDYTVEYFATSDDSIRTVMYEWNISEDLYDSLHNSDSPQTIIINAFNRKFELLDSTYTNLLGKPAIKDIKSSFLEQTERDDIKWNGLNQLNFYLLMFKRDMDTYRQIRLIVYPK